MVDLFALGGRRRLIGVVHLLPLPGAPVPSPGIDAVCARARQDAQALVAGGADGIIVENLGDAPFSAEGGDAITVAAMTRACLAVREVAPDLGLGVNVLRNDALAAMSVAAVVGAAFVRVNVHVGAMVTDQGVVTGRARDTLLLRRRLDAAQVRVAADVHVKHARPLTDESLEQAALDTWKRGRADALIVSGSGTGQPTSVEDVRRVRASARCALWIGSGVTPERAAMLGEHADVAIVGTWLHEDADLGRPLDPSRVARMREAWVGHT